MSIDFGTIVEFSNGVRVINATPHELSFLDGEAVVTVAPSGAKVNAKAVEVRAYGVYARCPECGEHNHIQGCPRFGGEQPPEIAELVRTVFEPSEEGEKELLQIQMTAPDVLVIGSIISAQAYPTRVLGMVPAPGFERVPPAEKRMSTKKFTTF